MRIALYTETSLPKLGGQELVVDALARQFTALGHRAVVLAPRRRSQGPFDPASVPYPMHFHPRFFSTRWGVAWYAHWLRKLHCRERFDVVHCHSVYPTAYVAACCAALADVPLVVTSHGGDLAPGSFYDRKPELRARYRNTLARVDVAVAISSFTRDAYRAVLPQTRHIVDIPNGVDLARFAQPTPRPAGLDAAIQPGRYLLFIGRLEPRKGIDVLLAALAATSTPPDFRLLIAGRGPEQPALAALAADLGLGDRVQFVGQVAGDLKTYLLQNARATVMPSRDWEAFPLVVLESYACGRPVLGTQIPGLRDVVWPERTGLLVPAEAPAPLAAALQVVVARPELADAWGAAGRRVAQDYAWQSIAQRYLACFEDCQRRARRAG